MGFDLRGKKVLLTGASSGIGWALAKAVAAKGAEVAISARREDALTQLALQIQHDGGTCHVLAADLSKRGAAAELATRAQRVMGRVDVLINNAGVGLAAAQWVAGDGDVAREMFETNYWSTMALVAGLAPDMKSRGSGTIVNVASMGAVLPFPMTGHYGSSKAAVATGTDALRLELRGTGVRVMLVMPGPVDTPMLAEARKIDGLEDALTFIRPGNADTLARLVVRGITRGKAEIVYPRPLWLTRVFPMLGRWVSDWIMRKMHADDSRIEAGGSSGSHEAREAREAFDAKRAA